MSSKDFSQSDWDNYRNKRIGFVFQSYNLIPHISVIANVEMPLVMAGEKKSECHKRAKELLKLVGLENHVNKKPLQLSGGQMQRVAIARALVANPDIILADEPTGALDNESSEQVMDILEQVAKDRLVIMVTHNNVLAEKYSTRIIDLSDGKITGDSNPYDGEILTDEVATETCAEQESEKKEKIDEKKRELLRRRLAKMLARQRKRERKSHLSFKTAVGLSARNLSSKKVRTSLTAFAGSIGIIGITLVMAFSTGVKTYINSLEEGALSLYPLTVEQTSINLASALGILMPEDLGRTEYPTGDEIYTNPVLSNIAKEIPSMLAQNDLASFKTHIDKNFNKEYGYVKYSYGTNFHVYAENPTDETEHMKVEPFIDVMESAMAGIPILSGGASVFEMMKDYASMLSSWGQMVNNRDLITKQYEIIGKGKWPAQEVYYDEETGKYIAEVVVVADKTNSINDYALLLLGLKSEDDIVEAFSPGGSFATSTYNVSDLVGMEYKIMTGSDYYYEEGGKWKREEQTTKNAEFINKQSEVIARVSAVIRPKEGSSGSSINGVIGYDSSLTDYLIKRAVESDAVIEQQGTAKDIVTGSILTGEVLSQRLVDMGVADLSKPYSISIYANSFEDKERIVEFIEEYNKTSGKQIKYTDTLETMMSFVNTMSDTITKVLIGFSSISLIVSSIMIAVIIYTSVLERRKEVGTLRSVGARKKDISVIFMAESGMLGMLSGIMGVFIAWLITMPVNLILKMAVGIDNLAIIEWWQALMMFLISFGLSITAGVIPAFIGAKQDPAVALRTE